MLTDELAHAGLRRQTAWPDSAVLDVVAQLPSAERWLQYASVYGEDGLERQSIFSKAQAQTVARDEDHGSTKSAYTSMRPGM